ncbi:hypothetical protein RHMOL_Rhmol06G0124300 [Rhododendron molle]|uniref:Uncharacterized protein n=1 Tax=Rhododendron molle TaxID=49168 RepID=A0ACC0NCP7_RHOML|nr:hypothetical protein RHMOL_Rhmol06G0124300 [Rhododendron molle]
MPPPSRSFATTSSPRAAAALPSVAIPSSHYPYRLLIVLRIISNLFGCQVGRAKYGIRIINQSFYTYFKAQSGKEISKSTLAQRARREREQILKQSAVVSGKENSQTQPLQEINVGAAIDEHCANNVRNREDWDREALKLRLINTS